jgi:hypothetical protein
MEPEVHIIEKYFQEIKHCLTMTNLKCEQVKRLSYRPTTFLGVHDRKSLGKVKDKRGEPSHMRIAITHPDSIAYPSLRFSLVSLIGL